MIIRISGICLDEKLNLYNNKKNVSTNQIKCYLGNSAGNLLLDEVLFTIIDTYSFHVIISFFLWNKLMPQMLMIAVK